MNKKINSTEKKPPIDTGLSLLYAAQLENKQGGQKLLQMIISGESTDEEIKALVNRESLLEMVLGLIDLVRRTQGIANQAKSKVNASDSKLKAQTLLYTWLDQNICLYKEQLEACAEAAVTEIKDLNRREDWVRREITLYNRIKKLS
jgi:hypothetical protein